MVNVFKPLLLLYPLLLRLELSKYKVLNAWGLEQGFGNILFHICECILKANKGVVFISYLKPPFRYKCNYILT